MQATNVNSYGIPQGCAGNAYANGTTLAPAAAVPGSPILSTCPAQPSNANGGMMFDIYAYNALTLTGFSWLMPSNYSNGSTSFPVQVLFRYGSITDGQNMTLYNATTGVYNGGAKGAIGQFPAVLANWTSVLNTTVTAQGVIAPLPGTVSIPLAAGQRGSLWMIFMDGTKPARSTDNITDINVTTADDGNLAVFRANQPTTVSQANWGEYLCAASLLTVTRAARDPHAVAALAQIGCVPLAFA